MKTVTFRPLRLIKKTGKITVASYMQWRKVMTADYSKFNLVVDDEYKRFSKEDYVHDHEGNLLYFYTYNPADVPVFHSASFDFVSLEEIQKNNKMYGINWGSSLPANHIHYNMPGTDCDGVPTFSHGSADYLATHHKDVSPFEPLTVAMVNMWFGWFLYQLENSYLKIGK